MPVLDMTADQHSITPAAGPLRVLIVEDSKRLREQLGESICSPGRIEVVGYAETQTQALEMLAQAPCDAVVLDLQLRQGNGLAVLKALRPPRQGRPSRSSCSPSLSALPRPQPRASAKTFPARPRYDRVRDVLEELVAPFLVNRHGVSCKACTHRHNFPAATLRRVDPQQMP